MKKWTYQTSSVVLQNRKRICAGLAVTVLALQFGVGIAWAAPSTIGDQEEQNQRARQEALERQQREQRQDVFLQPGTKQASETDLPEEGVRFPIHTLKLEGDQVEKFPWLEKQLSVYTGRMIGMQGINMIVKRLSNSLIDRGYVTTRIVIPEQDLSTGILKLKLIPGVIRTIRFQDDTQHANWRNAFPTRPGDILNLRNLEQGLEQLKRVPSQDADMKLVPGDRPGESDVVITLKRSKDWKSILSIDNSGSKATGKIQVSETYVLDNPFHDNDLFHITLNNDGDRENQHGTRGNSLYYSRPNGNWTYSVSQNHYEYHQTVFAGIQPMTWSGKSDDLKITAEKLLSRNQTSKTHLEMGITLRRTRNYLDDTEIEVQRKDTTAYTLALSRRQYLGQTTVDVRLGYDQGVPWFGAQQDVQGDGLPTVRYRIWHLDTTLTKPICVFGTKGQYRGILSAQYSGDTLYAADGFSIGNRYTVRGFDGEQTLTAERGWYMQNEISVPIAANGPEIYGGIDYGQVSGPSAASLSTKDLAGAVLGIRGAIGTRSQYDVFVGYPLKKPDEFKTATPTYGFQMIYQI